VALTYLSRPQPVNMADEWFELATLGHFWIQRRFTVFRKLVRTHDLGVGKIAEIGCGHGVVQRQLSDYFKTTVDGFDLNEAALKHSLAPEQPRFVYDINDRHARFEAAYDTIVLFDVLEHIEDEGSFLDAVLFHLKPGGQLLVNVPAYRAFYSRYDEVIGHLRRYSPRSLNAACSAQGLEKAADTCWGLPLLPLLLARKVWLARERDDLKIARRGYKPPGRIGNFLLGLLSSLEPIPQHLTGTSIMPIFRKPPQK
jgi:SAM-dependent methyltransferase